MSELLAFGLYDSAGTPLTTASPVFTVYKDSGGSPRTPPTIAHLAGAVYRAEIPDADVAAGVAFLITSGGGAQPPYLAGDVGGSIQAFALYDSASGLPVAGKSPSFAEYLDASGSPLASPGVSDFGSGLYAFVVPHSQYETGVAFDIDCGPGVTPARISGQAQDEGSGSAGPPVLPSTPVPLPSQAASVEAYARQLQQLFPPGVIWNFESDSELTKLVLGMAGELARVDARSDDLMEETDPRTASETLSDWETMLGLPDAVIPVIPGTDAERRLAITQTVIRRGGQNAAYYIGIALACGYPGATVQDGFSSGVLRAGFHAGDLCYGLDRAYHWEVTVPGSPSGTHLTHAQLEAAITAVKPSHTTVTFNYT